MILPMDNGAKPLLDCGTQERGVVLADWKDEYVVWHYFNQNGKSHCQHGRYFRYEDWTKARKAFNEAMCRFLGITQETINGSQQDT